MTDKSILHHIQELVEEEQQMYSDNKLTDDERKRLESLQVELDQCWDLLRQRRAKREFGEDPDEAEVRSPDTVENYEN